MSGICGLRILFVASSFASARNLFEVVPALFSMCRSLSIGREEMQLLDALTLCWLYVVSVSNDLSRKSSRKLVCQEV